MKTVIKRCPTGEAIQKLTNQVVSALQRELGVRAEVEDGAKGEFSVYVAGNPVMERDYQTLPTVAEVVRGVELTTPTAV